MVDAEAVQEHLALSREYLGTARGALSAGQRAPAYHNALHALELAVKAVLAKRLHAVPRTHNVGGLLAREFRVELGDDVCSRVNRLVRDYDAPRYPDWEAPEDLDNEIAFIGRFIERDVPRLLEAPS